MRRMLLIAYALIAWIGFVAVIVWAAAFLTPTTRIASVDRAASTSGLTAAAIDLALLGLFAVHHSVMARTGAKRRLTQILPAAAERSTYVLSADALLALTLWQWQGIPHVVWRVSGWLSGAIWVAYALGWLIAISSTFMIDHFDLVGLRQATSRAYAPRPFQARWLYRFVRHPLMLGLLIAFWATPTMTVGHLLFSGAATAYIAIGVWFEERDLRASLGAPYLSYLQHTPALIPGVRR